MISFRIIALLFSIVFLTTPVRADFEAATDAYMRGDYATALRELRPLAEQGHAGAQYKLGLLYANGQGVPKDDAQARRWYEKAAAQGHEDAQVRLGILYLHGQGVPEDYKMAMHWLRMPARRGNAMAQTHLGLLYERGNGGTQDFVLAYKWYILAAGNGDKLGAELRDALAKRMTPGQIFQAQELARPQNPKKR